MTNLTLVAAVVSTELLVLFQVTAKAFRASSLVEKDRGDDVREAVAGLEAARLIPRLAELFELANRLKSLRGDDPRDDPFDADEIEERRRRLADLLSRGDIALKLTAVAVAGAETRVPVAAKKRLVLRWKLLFWPLVVAHVAAPLFLLDNMLGKQVGPQAADTAAAVAFGVSVGAALIAGVLVGLADLAMGRAIEEGKDAR